MYILIHVSYEGIRDEFERIKQRNNVPVSSFPQVLT